MQGSLWVSVNIGEVPLLFDVIGDVHGYYDHLETLLRKLGYREVRGTWVHSGRKAVFVGDLVDRGPEQIRVVNTVRRMVDAGTALCIMGNHEFNAVAWTIPDPNSDGEFLRPHGKGSNRAQHQAFLDQVGEGSILHKEITDWFRTLPLWLDLQGIRVVHACWHERSLDWLSRRMPDNTLTDNLYVEGSRRDHEAFQAIEAVCKGLEVRLPHGVSFKDKQGHVRKEARIRWWEPELTTFKQAAIGPPELTDRIPDILLPPESRPSPYSGPPVFFGHYWFTGVPKILGNNAVCLDYSVANGGPLVAYRWEGESQLQSTQLVQSI